MTTSISIHTAFDGKRNGFATYPVFSIPRVNQDDLSEFRMLVQKYCSPHVNILKDGFQGELILPGPIDDEVAFLLRWDCVGELDDMFIASRTPVMYQFGAWLRAPKRTPLPPGAKIPTSCLEPRGFDTATRVYTEDDMLNGDWVDVVSIFDHLTGDEGRTFEDERGLFHAETSTGLTGEAAVIAMCAWPCASSSLSSVYRKFDPTPQIPEATISRHPQKFIPLELQQPPEWMLRDYRRAENDDWFLKEP
jgi:hypothetical protein